MKCAKIIGIFAFTAVAALAMAASASAVVVCSNSGEGALCATGHGREFTGTFHATGTGAIVMTTSGGATARTVPCNSAVHGHITNPTTGAGNLTSLSFNTCTVPMCEKVSVSTPRTGGPAFPWAGTVTSSGLNDTRGQLHVNTPSIKFTAICNDLGFPITATCEYEATTATANVIGGAPAKVEAKAVTLTKTAGSELVCGAKADWDGTYTVTTPTSLYIE